MTLVNDITSVWAAYFPSDGDRSIPRNVRQRSLYIYLAHQHFSVIMSIIIRVRPNRISVTTVPL